LADAEGCDVDLRGFEAVVGWELINVGGSRALGAKIQLKMTKTADRRPTNWDAENNTIVLVFSVAAV
jgi:hypothetical protein